MNKQQKIKKIRYKKKEYKNFLKYNQIDGKDFPKLTKLEKQDLTIRNFIYLLQISGQDKENFSDEKNILRTTTHFLYSKFKGENHDDFFNLISNYNKSLGSEIINLNIENENINKLNLKFSESELKILNFNEVYMCVGNIFSKLNIDKKPLYYKFGYLLSMYINLTHYINFYVDVTNSDLFILKIKIYEELINHLSTITPEYFNLIIIKNNKKLAKGIKKIKKG
ncbi:hypothetical protein [Mesoplasma photuris]|uniref:hypothetical protein n=1 Tax=Mesoplasma photuris TaxID=217731 RepID=UPI0004E16D90|nr:hypothetical protein [Mesoplasma photuris]